MAERVNIQKQLEVATGEGYIITTNSSGEQQYKAPGTVGQFLGIDVTGFPEWLDVGASIISLTRNEMLTHISNSTVIPLQNYLITDRGGASNTLGILVKGVTINRILDNCIYIDNISSTMCYDICLWEIGSSPDPAPDDIIRYRKNLLNNNEVWAINQGDIESFRWDTWSNNRVENCNFDDAQSMSGFYGNIILYSGATAGTSISFVTSGTPVFTNNFMESSTWTTITLADGSAIESSKLWLTGALTFDAGAHLDRCEVRGGNLTFPYLSGTDYTVMYYDYIKGESNFSKVYPQTINANKELVLASTIFGKIRLDVTDVLESMYAVYAGQLKIRIVPQTGYTVTIKDKSIAAVAPQPNIMLNTTLVGAGGTLALNGTNGDWAEFEPYQTGIAPFYHYRLVNYQKY